MIRIETLTAQDYTHWDNYVRERNAAPYLLSAWKQAIETSYGHRCHYLIAKKENEICGILPCVYIKTPLLSGELCSLPFCDVGGIIADSKEIVEELKHEALQLQKELKVKKFQLREAANHQHQDASPINNDLSHKKVRMILPLPESADALLKSFKSKLRSQIKKAEKNGLTVSLGNDQHHLDCFYDVFSINMRALGSPVHSKAWFEAIRNAYGEKMIISLVQKDGITTGAGIVLINQHTASIPWASTNARYNRLAPNMLLYWSLLEYVTNTGCTEFDFGRSTYGEGTFKFKKQWGAQPQQLNWHECSESAEQETATHSSKSSGIRQLVEAIWKKLPLAMVNRIGPNIRKYISL